MPYTRINNDWNDITGKPTNLATLPVDWGDLINIIFVGSSVMQAINWIGKIRIFKTTLP
ncbi:hypothetical protein [Raineya sp.]|jgi:hypothetical protein